MTREELIQEYGLQADLKNRLSYDSGIQNYLAVRYTNQQIRLRYENNTDVDMLYYFAPVEMIGVQTVETNILLSDTFKKPSDLSTFTQFLKDLNLPYGLPFYISLEDKDNKKAVARSMDEDRRLYILATTMNQTPIQIRGLNFRSFNKDGKPENSNYGNSITPYNINAYRDKRRKAPINLSAFQSSRDYSTEILKLDLIQHNIILPASQEDIFTFKVNAHTKLDITLDVGARDSRTERFYRDLVGGTKMLHERFPQQIKQAVTPENK